MTALKPRKTRINFPPDLECFNEYGYHGSFSLKARELIGAAQRRQFDFVVGACNSLFAPDVRGARQGLNSSWTGLPLSHADSCAVASKKLPNVA